MPQPLGLLRVFKIENDMKFTIVARRIGIFSAVVTIVLLIAYTVTLSIGLLSLPSPDQPISNPMFTIMELLIIVMMPVIVALMVAVYAWTPSPVKVLSFIAVIFMGLLAVVTSSLHFVILTTSRQTAFAEQPWLPLLFEFKWPSVAYSLDILGWDFFFPLSMLFAAPVFHGSRLALCIRWTMIVSGVLALAGLIGVVLGNMQFRNIGIVGYVGVFLIVSLLLAIFFYRESPQEA